MKLLPTIAIAASLAAFAAQAQPITSVPKAHEPSSRTASSITGPIIISTSKIIFSVGAISNLELVAEGISGVWDTNGEVFDGQIFKILNDPGELVFGNTWCGADTAPTYLVAYQYLFFNISWTMGLSVFSGDEVPTSVHSDNLCGTYGYTMDEPLATSGGDENSQASPVIPAIDVGLWSVRESQDPIDDSKVISMSLSSTKGTSSRGEPIIFIARCKSNETDAFVVWNEYVGSDARSSYGKSKTIQVRIDDQPPQTQTWGVSTDNEATFAPGWPGTMLKQMVNGEQLTLRMTPHGENPVTAIFDLKGMRPHLEKLAQTCNWQI